MRKILLFGAAVVAAMSMNAQVVMSCDDAYNAAWTLAAGDTLTIDGVTAIVEVTAYVTNGGNGTVSNNQQTFYVGQTANEATKTIQAYKCTLPEGEAAVNKGDKLKITGKLMHYRNASGSTDVAEFVYASAEILERVAVKVDTLNDLTVCEIIEEGEGLNAGAYSSFFVEITAVVDSLTFTSEAKKQQTFFFFCEDNGKTLQAYNAYMTDSIFAELGDTVKVLGKIMNYQGKQVELESPTAWVVGKAAAQPVIKVTVNDALAIGLALAPNAVTKEKYQVVGYVDSIATPYDATYGNLSFYMTDNMEEHNYDFMVYRGKYTEDIPLGTLVYVTGNIKNFHEDADPETGKEEKNIVEIVNGKVSLTEDVEAITATRDNNDKSLKVLRNGQLIIEKNGVRYNVLGTVVK